MIEFYGCVIDLDTGKVHREYETLIKPRKFPMSAETIAETKTRLSNEMLKNAPSFSDVADKLADEIRFSPLVIAHNLSFDQEMLDIEFERLGKQLVWPPGLCTVEQTIHLKGFRLNLTGLHVELFGQGFPEAHRAKADVQALARCCVELQKRGMLL